jgi:hypothetical protein
MRGNLDWAHETGRYRPPEGAHADTSASSLEALADDHRIFAWDDEDAAAAPASSHPAREVPPPAFHAPRPEPIRPWASDRTQ